MESSYNGILTLILPSRTNCTVKSEVLCFGHRIFLKNVPCNWTGGYKWGTALFLSITLGGFGADR
jgi:hypothetical protein